MHPGSVFLTAFGPFADSRRVNMASSYGSFPSRGGQDRRERSSSRLVALTLAGLALAAVIGVVGVMRRREANVLYELVPFGYRQHLQLARSAAMHPMSLRAKLHEMSEDYIGKWTEESLKDGSPSDFGALASMGITDGGVPVCYPSVVTDKSGRLQKAIPTAQLREMQRPIMNVVPSSVSSKLACTCATCDPQAGFPPVCLGCTCQETVDKPDVYILGRAKSCGGGDDLKTNCEDILGGGNGTNATAVNAMADWPECTNWGCYNKDGWFCACTCPGDGC